MIFLIKTSHNENGEPPNYDSDNEKKTGHLKYQFYSWIAWILDLNGVGKEVREILVIYCWSFTWTDNIHIEIYYSKYDTQYEEQI